MAFDRTRPLRLADFFAAALAASLPWSTTATGVLAVLWLLAIVPALDLACLRRVCLTPAGYLPFQAAEVAQARAKPIADVGAERRRLVEQATRLGIAID